MEAETVEDSHELAKEVKEDEEGAAWQGTGQTATMGRGLGSFLTHLQSSGALRAAGREELRGRAKDERHYEDYAPLDLKKVVQVDPTTEKDREFVQREVKLEYRDQHGRLLTRKEAFRDLSYQFHGHSSGKRKTAKKMEQIRREQAETRLASQQGGQGTLLGALRQTQSATGKAFVVHKTT